MEYICVVPRHLRGDTYTGGHQELKRLREATDDEGRSQYAERFLYYYNLMGCSPF